MLWMERWCLFGQICRTNPTYKDNHDKLLSNLKGVLNENRRAKFKTVVAFVDDKTEHYAVGIVRGLIVEENKGKDDLDMMLFLCQILRTYLRTNGCKTKE